MRFITLLMALTLISACAKAPQDPQKLAKSFAKGQSGITAWVNYYGQPCLAVTLNVASFPEYSNRFTKKPSAGQIIGKLKDKTTPEAKILVANVPAGKFVMEFNCTVRNVTDKDDGKQIVETKSFRFNGVQTQDNPLIHGVPTFIVPEGKIVDLGYFDVTKVDAKWCGRNCYRWKHRKSDPERQVELRKFLTKSGLQDRLIEVTPGATPKVE